MLHFVLNAEWRDSLSTSNIIQHSTFNMIKLVYPPGRERSEINYLKRYRNSIIPGPPLCEFEYLKSLMCLLDFSNNQSNHIR